MAELGDKLSKREIEILLLICDELTDMEIANKLNLAKTTINAHRLRIKAKIGCKNVVGMVKYAYNMDYIEPIFIN